MATPGVGGMGSEGARTPGALGRPRAAGEAPGGAAEARDALLSRPEASQVLRAVVAPGAAASDTHPGQARTGGGEGGRPQTCPAIHGFGPRCFSYGAWILGQLGRR